MLTEDDITLMKDLVSIISRLLEKTQIGRFIKKTLKIALRLLKSAVKSGIKKLEMASKIAGNIAVAFDVDDNGIPSIVEQVSGRVIEAIGD